MQYGNAFKKNSGGFHRKCIVNHNRHHNNKIEMSNEITENSV